MEVRHNLLAEAQRARSRFPIFAIAGHDQVGYTARQSLSTHNPATQLDESFGSRKEANNARSHDELAVDPRQNPGACQPALSAQTHHDDAARRVAAPLHLCRRIPPHQAAWRRRWSSWAWQPGDRVGTFAWNNYQHLELYYAIPGAGAVCHTLNIRLFPDQLAYIVNHAEDKIVFVDGTLMPLYQKVAPHTQSVCSITCFSMPARAAKDALPNALFYEDLIDGQRRGVRLAQHR
jgi:hypothetical protein